MKGVMRFYKKGKLSPRYVGTYRILKRVSNVACELELPAEAVVHPVFHISLLKKCVGDPASIVPLELVLLRLVSLMKSFIGHGAKTTKVTDGPWSDTRPYVRVSSQLEENGCWVSLKRSYLLAQKELGGP
ncbi:hypothetical protein MTR67_039536 [Solanum verrucosum]|uniref:Tf2-1-like SH3-like domain-containing protein n=1 Tax=Solanum verrucosum TaxID=315347 RepID=A0AAF0UIM4_SOLVR|nr:hypothetical protein MTR67_039536 [Solanum verrucosum]